MQNDVQMFAGVFTLTGSVRNTINEGEEHPSWFQ